MNHGAPAAAAAAAPDGDVAAWVALLDGLPGAAWLVALATQRVVAVNAAAAALAAASGRMLRLTWSTRPSAAATTVSDCSRPASPDSAAAQ